MKHLEVMKLLNSLASSKKILEELEQYDDYDVVELLEMKYEKLYRQLAKN
jgi:hypothetical protein